MSKPLPSITSLKAITKESSATFDRLVGSASKASRQSTSTLTGVAGGFVGMATAYALSFVAPIALPIAGPIATGFGIITAILMFRGRSTIEFERRLDQNRTAANEIMSRIKALPKNAPASVQIELWNTYNALNSTSAVSGKGLLPLRSSSSASLSTPQIETNQAAISGSTITDV